MRRQREPVGEAAAPSAGDAPGTRDARSRVLRRLDRLAWLLDGCIRVPLTRRRIGLDGIISLIPVVGDAASAVLSLYLIAEARRFRLPAHVVGRMLWHVLVDTVIGSIPIAGDLFDLGYKANRRNVELLRQWLREHHGAADGDGVTGRAGPG